MSAAVMAASMTRQEPRNSGRAAGAFWLMTVVTGAFAFYFGAKLVVSGDAAATAASILAHQPQFRFGVAVDLIATICYIGATVFVYDLFKPVNRQISLLAAAFSLTGCAIGALSLSFRLFPLIVLGGANFMSAFTTAQLQAVAYASLRLGGPAATISFVFFGLHCLLVGLLILTSTLIPRVIGVLMVCAGLGWLTQGFASLLSPTLARALSPYILIPGILGESVLSVRLLFFGVKES